MNPLAAAPSRTPSNPFAPLVLGCLVVTVFAGSAGAVTLVEEDDFSLAFGVRLQPRIELEREAGASGGEWRRDFMVRRARISANGRMQGASYKLEWKIDGNDRLGANPSAQLENGYIQYPVGGGVEIRAGLYDQPFSRDRLTSDSQQLVVDRGAVSGLPDSYGLADNAVGLHVLGKLGDGHAEYAVGLFDNRMIPTRLQDTPMVVGRLDLNFGSTKDVFSDAHFGNDRWYSLGVNGSFQGGLEDTSGADQGSNAAIGVDGMVDVPVGPRRVFLKAEVNSVSARRPTGGEAVTTTAWMAGMGILLFDQRFEPAVRFDQVRYDDAVGGGTSDITYVGATLFQKKHQMKLQADVRFEGGTREAIDGARLQAQFYY